jgi:hypothetical protein
VPYKRRLRLLLVAPVHPEWAEEARSTAARIGANHIEPRAVPRVGRRETEWADLILTLEPAARDALPSLPPRIQVRHVEFPPATDAPARQDVIEEHLRGILGGLRLMARSDEDD